ncbi:Uncharacterised protein [Mycobacteroides abscessus subsp. abscessus]|nr:Uncharacterised protein [Mycobacteroides abscessus subsp. abscessus]
MPPGATIRTCSRCARPILGASMLYRPGTRPRRALTPDGPRVDTIGSLVRNFMIRCGLLVSMATIGIYLIVSSAIRLTNISFMKSCSQSS